MLRPRFHFPRRFRMRPVRDPLIVAAGMLVVGIVALVAPGSGPGREVPWAPSGGGPPAAALAESGETPPASSEPGLPAMPRRIVSLAPSTTEILFAVGAGGRVVGVTSHCDFPPEVAGRARVGGYDTPNVELVLALKPDLVVVPEEGSLLGTTEKLRGLGLRVETVRIADFGGLFRGIERVGEVAGRGAAGRTLACELERRLRSVERAVRGLPGVRTLMVVDHDPIVAAGRGTFGHALLEAAGGVNVVGGASGSYPRLGAEAVLGLRPEAIVDLSMAKQSVEVRASVVRERWARFGALPAVRQGKVFSLEPDELIRPGPRLLDGLERLARALHPEAFPAAGAGGVAGSRAAGDGRLGPDAAPASMTGRGGP